MWEGSYKEKGTVYGESAGRGRVFLDVTIGCDTHCEKSRMC